MTSTSPAFSALLQAAASNEAIIPVGWGQGRATFGGLVAALLYQYMASQLEDVRPLRSLSLSFVGPVEVGPVQLSARVLRQGKGVTQVEGHLSQNGEILLAMIGSFGVGRESIIDVPATPAPSVKPPQQCPALPYIPNVTPEFTQLFEYRWTTGGMPFMGNPSREMGGWVRFKDCAESTEIAHLLALVDAWPPALLPLLKKPAPASSLCWTIEFAHPLAAGTADEFWLYEASIDHARDGYGHIEARLWSQQGQLVALSRQTVTVFA